MSTNYQRTLGLLQEIIAALYADGWIIASTIALGESKTNNSILVFRKDARQNLHAHNWLALVFSQDRSVTPSQSGNSYPDSFESNRYCSAMTLFSSM